MTALPEQTLLIEKLVGNGYGLGRLADGKVALVRHVLPGERVLVRTRQGKKNFIYADLLEVLEPSPQRIEPPCPVYGRCGGCDFQHTAPASQLLLKCAALAETLQRSGLADQETITRILLPPLTSPEVFGYRQRIRLHVDNQGRLGFHGFHSHKVMPISTCPLAAPEINGVLGRFHSLPLPGRFLDHTIAMELLLDQGGNHVVALVHFSRRPRPADLAQARELLATTAGLGRLFFIVAGHGLFNQHGRQAAGDDLTLSFSLPPAVTNTRELTLTWEAGGFCQVNLPQNENMISTLLNWAGISGNDQVLDLFCGMGNFSLPLCLVAGRVLGLDGQGSAIRSARRNARLAGRHNCQFEKIPVPAGVQKLVDRQDRFPLIIMDPPRQGAALIIPLLAALRPRQLIVISCDPATLARDLSSLAGHGFRVQRILPVDMFPQTHHLESISLLQPG